LACGRARNLDGIGGHAPRQAWPTKEAPVACTFKDHQDTRARRLIDEDFLERYARAREAQADKLFKECLTIADAARPEDVNVARLRVDTRKWAAARLAPKKYGDRVSHNVKGAGSINFQPQILISCSSAGEEQEYIDISAAPEAAGGLPQQGNGNSLPGSGGRR
jgi:hypothetical protein